MRRIRYVAAAAGALAFQICGAHAQSAVTLYGLTDVFAGSLKNSGAPAHTSVLNNGGMTTSYFGLRGREDLGGGMGAFFALESYLRVDSGTSGRFSGDPLFARGAYVGVDGRFGKVALGRNANPYFVSTLSFNAFRDSFTFSPMMLHTFIASGLGRPSIQGDTAWSNSVLYTTPSWSGFTSNLIYALGESPGHSGQGNYGANITYAGGKFSATLAAQYVAIAPLFNNGATTQKAIQAGVAYDFAVTKLFAQYQYANSNNTLRDNTYSISAATPVGAGNVLIAWAHTARSITGTELQRRNTASIGYDYYLSKRTDVYLNYMYDKVSGLATGNSFGLGIRHRF
ncbi:porin [Cupriavidus necator]|uniref:porin n=1 Tax=Cupriavidus necator TaxID=106590 RepID=UPI002785C6FE|nr:porin [Cupriavidus necator]MDQ0141330.1 putative porin [Cupriavidus necator]